MGFRGSLYRNIETSRLPDGENKLLLFIVGHHVRYIPGRVLKTTVSCAFQLYISFRLPAFLVPPTIYRKRPHPYNHDWPI